METVQETLQKNQKQKEFYNHKKKSLPTRIWSYVRLKGLGGIRKELGIAEQSYQLHHEWFGDLSDKKVLDLGCFAGNHWSFHLAKHAKQYVAIDLSEVGIKRLNSRLESIPTARAVAVDFFSDEFEEADFDLIYAYGVLHHFQNVDNLIDRLNQKLAADGQIISYDPLQTSTPIWILRKLYRPFQSDAAWEWPFSRKTVRKFGDRFHMIERRGVLGRSKWYALIGLLPLSRNWKLQWGKKAHKKDWEGSHKSDKDLFRCMQVNLLMQKKAA